MKERIQTAKRLGRVIAGLEKYMYIIVAIFIFQIPLTLISPLFYRMFIDEVLMNRQLHYLYVVIGWNIVSFLIIFGVNTAKLKYENKFYNGMNFNMRIKVFGNYVHMPYSTFDKYTVGDMKMRLDDDIVSVEDFYRQQMIDYTFCTLQFVGNGLAMLLIDYRLFLVALLMLPITFVIGHFLGKGEKKINAEARVVRGEKNQWMVNSLQNWKEIKALTVQKKEKVRFTKYYHKLGKLDAIWITYWLMHSLIIPAIKDEFIMRFSLYFIGGILIINGKLTIGSLLIFISYFSSFYKYVNKINSYNIEFKNMMPVISRVIEIVELKKPENLAYSGDLEGNIKVKNLSYQYINAPMPVLDNINFEIKAGETIAIVGKSGVGKSTLAKLLAGILKKEEGEILYDNRALEQINLDCIFKNIGIVMQDSLLFNLSIRENLIFAGGDVSEEALDNICEMVNLKGFIESLPDKYETLIGESGIKLSGGQRQRLVVARTLLSKSNIIILDEATSSLDNESETMIREALHKLGSAKTIVIIAHRLSSIISADKVLILKDGKVAGFDSHNALKGSNNAYDELFA